MSGAPTRIAAAPAPVGKLGPLGPLVVIFVGGALGTAARALVGVVLPAGWVALPTLVVNLMGAFAIGLLYQTLSLASADGRPQRGVRLFVGTGVLGGFTTYSALEVATAAHGASGVVYGLVSVCAGLVACYCGLAAASLIYRLRTPIAADARSEEAS